MVYIKPQARVFQEYAQRTNPLIDQMYAHIAGGHAALLRLSDVDEKALASLGQYDPDAAQSIAWPERPAGALVDPAYTKVLLEKALLRYLSDADDSGMSISTVANRTNAVRVSDAIFASGNGYTRSAALLERDVQVGDVARVQATVSGTTYTTVGRVAAVEADKTAATAAATGTAEGSNQATVTAGSTGPTFADGQLNCVSLAESTTAYNPSGTLPISETFTITVTKASSGGDLSTALVDITSTSGLQNSYNVAPAAGTGLIEVSPGVTLAFSYTHAVPCSDSAAAAGVSDDDLLVGQTWTYAINSAYTVPAAVTVGGTYVGTVDDTYIIEVIEGRLSAADGDPSDDGPNKQWPRVIVRTTKGSDSGGPYEVIPTDVGGGDLQATIPLGSNGLTLTFDVPATDEIQLVTGDKWTVTATAAADAQLRTLVLDRAFATEVIENGATAVSLDLFIEDDVWLPEKRETTGENWTASATEITINAGATASHPSWTDAGETPALPIDAIAGWSNMYLEARYWLKDLANAVTSVAGIAELDDLISGPLHPDNPLKYGAFKALQNANGAPVRLTAICNPSDIDEWVDTLALLEERTDVRNLVPLTRDPAVWSAYQAHIEAMSSPEAAGWRRMWVNGETPEEVSVVSNQTSSDGELVLAVLEDDPGTSGTQYTQVRVPAGNGDFVTNGVQALDVIRTNFQTANDGTVTYDSFVVDAVLNEDTLRLVAGPDAAISTPQKLEVWRALSRSDKAVELAKTGGFSDRRVSYVWPSQLVADGSIVEGYYLCCALAGLVSGIVPQQGITQMAINGFTSVLEIDKYTTSELNVMAEGGVHLVVADSVSGEIHSRHAVTTADNTDISRAEEMIVRNVDSVSYYFDQLYSPYIGKSNVVESFLEQMEAQTRSGIARLQSSNLVPQLGGQLVDGELISVRPHELLKGHVIVDLSLTFPAPANNIDAHLLILV